MARGAQSASLQRTSFFPRITAFQSPSYFHQDKRLYKIHYRCYRCISEPKMLFCCHKVFITTFNCLKIVQFNVSWICYILRLVISPQVKRVEVQEKIRMDFLLTRHYMAESQTNIHNRIKIITVDIQHSPRHCTPKRMCLNVHETFPP